MKKKNDGIPTLTLDFSGEVEKNSYVLAGKSSRDELQTLAKNMRRRTNHSRKILPSIEDINHSEKTWHYWKRNTHFSA